MVTFKDDDDGKSAGSGAHQQSEDKSEQRNTRQNNRKKMKKSTTVDTVLADIWEDECETTNNKQDKETKKSSGIISDFKQTIGTHWVKEMTNFNQKTIAVSFFLFFAAIAPAITFGAIYAKVTHNFIGPVEMIAATAWCGIFYSLIGGMPIVSTQYANPIHVSLQYFRHKGLSFDIMSLLKTNPHTCIVFFSIL